MTKLYFSIDIEKAGDRFSDPILMIGCCLGDEKGKVIETKAFCGTVPKNEDFQPRCWQEFWQHELAILERIRKNATTTMLEDFMEYYYKLDERFGPFTKSGENQLTLLIDNLAYDINAIDCMLCSDPQKRFSLPLRYMKTGEYMRVNDGKAVFKTLDAETRKRVKAAASKDVSHDHWAENDATVLYRTKILSDQVYNPSSSSSSSSSNSMRPGDWWCSNCNDFVFASKAECRKCGAKKPKK